MRFIIDETKCKGCGRLLDVMDDVVPVTPVVAGGTPWGGFFHRECFTRLPVCQLLTRNWRDFTETQIRAQPRLFPVVASSLRFLVVDRPGEAQVGVYYLDWFAEHRLDRDNEWSEYRNFLTGDASRAAVSAAAEAELVSATELLKLQLGGESKDARLTWLVPISREIEFPAPAFEAHTAKHGPLNGLVDFSTLAAETGLTPIRTFGDPARCRGVVKRVDSTRAGYQVVYTALQPVVLEVGRDGLTELQQLLIRLKSRTSKK